MGEAFAMPRVARAAASADIDQDGDLDLLVTTNGGPAVLFRNDGVTNNGLRVKLEGSESNRNGLGAKVTVTWRGESQSQTLESGAGYLSSSELVLTFGLGSAARVEQVEVVWPSGAVDTIDAVDAGQMITVGEGRGVITSEAFR
jgi:hypothetical protein